MSVTMVIAKVLSSWCPWDPSAQIRGIAQNPKPRFLIPYICGSRRAAAISIEDRLGLLVDGYKVSCTAYVMVRVKF